MSSSTRQQRIILLLLAMTLIVVSGQEQHFEEEREQVMKVMKDHKNAKFNLLSTEAAKNKRHKSVRSQGGNLMQGFELPDVTC